MGKIRIALIGCGEQGAGTLLPCALATPEATVTAVCDMDRVRAQAVAARWRIPAWFDDVGALLRAQVADALMLATSPQGHASILREVLPEGLPIFVEKPAAASLSALQPLLGLASADSMTQVGHNLRFAPAILQLERLAQRGIRCAAPVQRPLPRQLAPRATLGTGTATGISAHAFHPFGRSCDTSVWQVCARYAEHPNGSGKRHHHGTVGVDLC